MKKYKLGNICFIQSGGTPDRSVPEYYNSPDIPWAKVGDLEHGKNVVKTEEFISYEGLKAIGNRVFEKNTVLLALYGSTLGKTCISDIKLSCNQAVLGMTTVDDNILDNTYLKYWFDFNKERIVFRQKGGAQKNLNANYIKSLEIVLPSLKEQKSAVVLLQNINNLTEKRKHTIALIEEYIDSLFYHFFGDPVINEKEWKKEKLIDIVRNESISYGVVKSGFDVDGGVPIVRPIDLQAKYLSEKGLKTISPEISQQFKRTILQGDELLISVRGSIGAVSLVDIELKNANVSRGIIPLQFDSPKLRAFYYYLLRQKNTQMLLHKKARGIGLKQINTIDLKNLEIIRIEDESYLDTFYQFTLKGDIQRKFFERCLEVLQELFQSVLFQIFVNPDTYYGDPINELISDEINLELFLNTINTSDFQTEEQYTFEVEKLFKILDRTQEFNGQDASFKKGIIQRLQKSKIILEANREYKNRLLDEAITS